MNQSLGASFNIIQLAGEIFGSLPPKPQFSSIKKTGNIIFMDIHYIHTGTVWEWVMPPWPVAVHWCPSPLQTFIELFPKHLVKIIPKNLPLHRLHRYKILG